MSWIHFIDTSWLDGVKSVNEAVSHPILLFQIKFKKSNCFFFLSQIKHFTQSAHHVSITSVVTVSLRPVANDKEGYRETNDEVDVDNVS